MIVAITKGISSPQMSQIHLSKSRDLPLRAIPPLTALLAFERAASQLSFRRAARDLALSPSAISHQIRGLELQFGVKLFVRGARSVRLTADGERYLAKVSSQPRAWPAWLNEAGMAELTPRGHLWLDSVPAMLEAAEQGLGVTHAMAPLTKAPPVFGRPLVG